MQQEEFETRVPGPLMLSRAATDTVMFAAFNSLPGAPTVLGYNYTNGTGYFFGTNFLDIDQDPNTPHQFGTQAIAQGYVIDSLHPYHIDAVLLRVGLKQKNSPFGTPLTVSLQLADGESSYNINSGGTPISYNIKAPGTGLAQVSVPYDSIKAGFGTWYTRVNMPAPVLVNRNYFVVLDFADFYLNEDKIGMYASASGGASQIFGKENTLWLYPSPFLWLQVSHIYTTVDRCIAIFPIIDDGTSGTECIGVINGIRNATSYPNPCSDKITITFGIDKPSDAVISLVDQNGRTIEEVVLRNLPAGTIEHNFTISGLAEGLYFYTIETNQGNLARKFIKSN
jgi:hypothetical protein